MHITTIDMSVSPSAGVERCVANRCAKGSVPSVTFLFYETLGEI